jgi:CubicO group peptidase (beta-lactamase class C family)
MEMYSGVGAFDVLTKIIQIVTETDYLSFLKKEIFDPCEMIDTTFVPTLEQKSRMMEMHQRSDGKNIAFKMPSGCVFESYPHTHYLGGAGLVSTLCDYSKFAKMLLHRGKTKSGRLIREESFDLLCTPQVSSDIMQGNERWGLGVRVITDSSYPYLPKGSFGWSGAYGSHFWIDPVNRIVAVFMKNSKFDGGAANESARNFEEAVYTSI